MPLFSKLLIANRGEIACRIIRTARRMGIRTVAVYSEADAAALHVAMADEAIGIGPAPARESYLDSARIIDAATQSGATAIHPGYGFLSESADFAASCEAAGLIFVGPPAAAIRAMGSKAEAKALMAKAGVPLVPGYHGAEQSDKRLTAEATKIGYPILIKASAGGGGKGMRVVTSENALAADIASARREATAAFGDDRLLLEKYLIDPRHIEMQIFADAQGNVVHLFERDCSIQRRHQKLIEEAPAMGLSDAQREALAAAAIAAARAVQYRGAGTIEFVASGGKFYFIEMNTRLQVEHPVTELITGLDLVEWQLRVAAGEALPLTQAQIARGGHAIEARLYAEDPARDFLPGAGPLARLSFPAASDRLRVETGFREGDHVTPYYDALLAKLIAWGETRGQAIERLQRALTETKVAGIASNRDLLLGILSEDVFAAQPPDTGFIARHRLALLKAETSLAALVAAGLAILLDRPAAASGDPHSPWQQSDGWRLFGTARESFRFRTSGGGERLLALVFEKDGYRAEADGAAVAIRGARWVGGTLVFTIDGTQVAAEIARLGAEIWVMRPDAIARLDFVDPLAAGEQGEAGAGRILAPMPGKVSAVLVAPGGVVKRGDTLMLIEAMKMEHAIVASVDATVAAIHFAPGALVEEGAELLTLEPAA